MSKVDKRSLKILREALPANGVKIIQERIQHISIDYINKILNGTRYSREVLNVAIQVAKEEKEKNDALKNEIHELAKY